MGAPSGILFILHVCVIMVVLILSIVSLVKIHGSEYRFIQNIGENWNKGPITSIVPRDYQCQPEEEKIIRDEWPGTTWGCDCSGKVLWGASIRRGKCDRGEDSNEYWCDDIRPIEPIPYTIWSGRVWCGQRLPYSYLDFKVARSAEQCPSLTKACGIIDTKKNVLCLDESLECPINKLRILQKRDAIPTDFNYKVELLDSEKRLIYTNQNMAGEIIHEFKISQETPCIDTGYENMTIKPHILSEIHNRYECPVIEDTGLTIDTRTEFIDSESYNKLLSQNGIEALLYRLPEYIAPSDSVTTSLWSKDYYGISSDCRNEIKENSKKFLEDLIKFEDRVQSIKTWVTATLITSAIGFVVFVVFLFLTLFKGNENAGKPGFIQLGLFLLFGILLIIFSALAISKSNNLPEEYKILEKNECSDAITEKIVSSFSVAFDLSKQLNLANAILSGILLVLPFVYCLTGFSGEAM